jgi:signal transduction histidine kinase
MSTRRRLSQLLLASHVGLVLLFALLLLATGVGTIRAAVVGQARTEAERAVSEARVRLEEGRRELMVTADLLAEHPTLRYYLESGQLTKARALVSDFHATSDVDHLGVHWNGQSVNAGAAAPPATTDGLAFDARGDAWRVVRRELVGGTPAWLLLAKRVGAAQSMAPSAGALVQLQLQPLRTSTPPAEDDWAAALRRVSDSGEPATVENVGPHAAARIVSLRGDDGRPMALLSAAVHRDWAQQRLLEWLAGWGGAALATLAIALALAMLLAARIARPFDQLARQAERLGGGDLATPVARPRTFLAEPVALARSLEDMRTQVAALTSAERAQREELDAILDGVDEGIAGVDADDVLHYANRQFLALLGMAREQVLGRHVHALLQPVGLASPANDDVDGMPPLERYRPLGSARTLTLRRLGAGPRRLVLLREENVLEAARAMRDRILANLSHEFQTPLSAQMASIELLRDHLQRSDDKVAIRLADAQFRGAMRLSHLVENLLDSVRIESGQMRLRRQPVDLPAVLEEAIELMQPLVDQRDQRVVADIQAGPLLTADGPRLLSVVVNLLANANKFAPDQTTIRVATQWASDHVAVWVQDEGPGLPDSYCARDLFAPFRRAPDEEPGQRGTGLGLAIVHAIVVAHGGEVRLERGGERGARIGIVLPLGAAA